MHCLKEFDEDIEDYHADSEYLNKSKLKTFLDDPKLFGVSFPPKKTSALTLGDLVHKAFQYGEEASRGWMVIPAEHSTTTGWKSTKKTKEFRETLDPDITWITESDKFFLADMWNEVRANPAAQSIVDDIEHHEVSIRWTREDGTKLKCRPDGISRSGRVVDWKTCRYANPLKDWWKAVLDYGYHMQDALYREGARRAGFSDDPLIFVLISTSGSHQVQVVELPYDACMAGQRMVEQAISGIAAHKVFGTQLAPAGYGELNTLPMPNNLFKEIAHGSNSNAIRREE